MFETLVRQKALSSEPAYKQIIHLRRDFKFQARPKILGRRVASSTPTSSRPDYTTHTTPGFSDFIDARTWLYPVISS